MLGFIELTAARGEEEMSRLAKVFGEITFYITIYFVSYYALCVFELVPNLGFCFRFL